nr:hypothetical protein [Candidatus Sigynarchaeota archaeon]
GSSYKAKNALVSHMKKMHVSRYIRVLEDIICLGKPNELQISITVPSSAINTRDGLFYLEREKTDVFLLNGMMQEAIHALEMQVKFTLDTWLEAIQQDGESCKQKILVEEIHMFGNILVFFTGQLRKRIKDASTRDDIITTAKNTIKSLLQTNCSQPELAFLKGDLENLLETWLKG